MWRKIISFMIAIAVVFAALPMGALSETDTGEENIEQFNEEPSNNETEEQMNSSDDENNEQDWLHQLGYSDGDSTQYQYMLNSSKWSAYAVLGKEIKSNNLKFFDGIEMGITDKANAYYNEIVTLDGVVGRKQYSSNSSFFKMDKSFYSEGDKEFLFSLMFYDFGPSEGKFYFEYFSKKGGTRQVELIKPGINPGWAVKTIAIDDLDLNTTYDNGSHFRIINGAFNAFAKAEVVNVSKAKREKTSIYITCLEADVLREMVSLRLIQQGDERFQKSNLSKPCTFYDAKELNNFITTGNGGTVSTDNKTKEITQGELLDIFFKSLGFKKNDNESFVEAAERLGISKPKDFLLFDEARATNYNLINLAHSVLLYEKGNGDILLADLIKNGVYADVDPAAVKSDTFQYIYYREPRKLPYETITSHLTGRQYHYINFFGTMLNRGYLTRNCWAPDGSGFACATPSGAIYFYNVDTQMLTYLDKGSATTDPSVLICRNGWAYYRLFENGVNMVKRVHPITLEKEIVYIPPKNLTLNGFTVTNDGRYLSLLLNDLTGFFKKPKDTTLFVRVDLETNEYIHRYYSFDFENEISHIEINPTNPDLIMFCHNAVNVDFGDIYDRVNVMNMKTGEVISVYQGINPNRTSIQLATHETWSQDGEYIYYCTWPTNRNSIFPVGDIPAVVRTNADGSHRQYFKSSPEANHANASGDNKMICYDAGWVCLLSAETHQIFPIIPITPIIGGAGHPYHPHPHLSYSGNKVSWGHVHNGVLGIAWMDYTDILENEVAKGGRYPFGEDVVRVSYKGVECESDVITKYGRECAVSRTGKSMVFDINPEIIDTVNGAVKITFDYYDNTTDPLILTYTKGVEEPNDAILVFNKKVEIGRRATNKWKTAEIVIDCGNFENIGKFESDFKITSTSLNAYIANIKVVKIENKNLKR